jgi:GNAT superfamily N-acetyltransferase
MNDPTKPARARAHLAAPEEIGPLRTLYCAELNCQVVHHSLHRREGWTVSYLLELDGPAGFGSIAVGGPWKDKPTIFEFFVRPEHRGEAFALFEAFLELSAAQFFEVQSSDLLLAAMLHTYGRDVASESIVFADRLTTSLAMPGATLRRLTADEEIRTAIERRQGGGEWELELEGQPAGKGGILFHYNRPYGDIYMEVDEPFRRRGLGAFLVQELKQVCHALGAIPAARCNTTNVASRRTLQRAGFVPYAHLLTATIPPTPVPGP